MSTLFLVYSFRIKVVQHRLVCSDLISRGIDISHVSHVINYDAPVDVRKYVHRVGRTARAGRSGTSWTLLEEQEARYFKGMMKEIDHLESIQKVKVTEDALKALQPIYEVRQFNHRFKGEATHDYAGCIRQTQDRI